MEQRISLITLGVADVSRARTFYERLGWHGQELEETVFFQAGGMALILWGRAKLADDSGVADTGAGGFDGVVLAHNLRSRAEVDALLAARPRRGPRSRGRPGRPSTAVTPAASATRTATSGKSPGTPASPSGPTAPSSCPTSARTRGLKPAG